MTTMTSPGIARGAMCLALLVSATGCAGSREPSYPIPDEPGIYAFTEDYGLRRLDGDREWEVETWPERSDLPASVQFVINDPALAGRSAGGAVKLWRAAWVRSDINALGQAMPVAGSEWAVAPLESFSVPFRYESPPGQTEIVHIVPAVPLGPGLYTLRIADPGARQARIGVAWTSVDQRQYAAANCVDRYEGDVYRACPVAVGAVPAPVIDPLAAGVTANAPVGDVAVLPAPAPAPVALPAPVVVQPPAPVAAPAPAVAQPIAISNGAEGLQISLLDPVRRGDGLLIQGAVTNTSSETRAIPAMQGSLENYAGQEIRRWVFQPQVSTLAPGERTDFQTEVRPLPSGVARANVAFIATR